MSPRTLRLQLLSAWYSITRSLILLAFDRRLSIGMADEVADCTLEYALMLRRFRDDVAIARFGSRWLDRKI